MARRATRFVIPLAVFGLLVVILALGLRLDPREVPSPLIGKPAPAFKLARLDRPNTHFETSQFQDKVWLLNVWASWCAECLREHEVLKRLARDDGVTIVGLNYKDQRDDALKWLSRLGNPYVLSIMDADGRVGIDWGVYGVPETFIIDHKGMIRYKHIGPLSEKVVNETVLPMINKLTKQAT